MRAVRFAHAVLVTTAMVLLASCGERAPSSLSPVAPSAAKGLFNGSGGLTLLSCTPLPADTATQAIGPAGGTLLIGRHTLTVPPHSLDSTVIITAVAPSATVNRLQFSPAGLTFHQPASLTMSYANCGLLGGLLPKQIVYTTDLLQILEGLGGADNILAQTVTAKIHHFSDYVVAW